MHVDEINFNFEVPDWIRENCKGVRDITTRIFGKVRKGPNGKNLCHWCKTEVKPPQRNWCSAICSNKYNVILFAVNKIPIRDKYLCQICGIDCNKLYEEIRDLERASDKGYDLINVAKNCLRLNIDMKPEDMEAYSELKEKLFSAMSKYPSLLTLKPRPNNRRMYWNTRWVDENGKETKPPKRKKSIPLEIPRITTHHSQGYEVDHIIPVCKGGTSLPDNLRTLCLICHRKETASLAKERLTAQKE